MGGLSGSTLGEGTGVVKQVQQPVPHFVRRFVPGVCGGRGIIPGVASTVQRFCPAGISPVAVERGET